MKTLRFARSWVAGGPSVDEREIMIDRGGEQVPAILFLPRSRAFERRLPGWVVLHGITRPGRNHPSILRFSRSLASTGAAVLIPEVPEWTRLELAPEAAVPTIKAAILALDGRSETAPGRTGLIGFSFGAPQALIAAADPILRGHLAAVVGFGGYADIERAFRFQFTGRHEWNGQEYEPIRPDPYGRWVVGANYLTRLPGFEGAGDVARALRMLASAAGEKQIASWDPVHEPKKQAVREQVAPERRHVFDLFAPPADEEPDPEESEVFIRALAREARKNIPLLNPLPHLDRIEVPVRLLHGRNDHLIPFSESLRLHEGFPAGADVGVSITGLFSHSEGAQLSSYLHGVREAIRFGRALREVFDLVRS